MTGETPSLCEADSVGQVLADVETFLDLCLDRFGDVLEHCRAASEREHDLVRREEGLLQATREFKERQQRWASQRDQEIVYLQQQVEELTDAWLRLEHEQRAGVVASPPSASEPERPAMLPSAAEVPDSGGLNSDSGVQPALRSSIASPAPIPATLKNRSNGLPGPHAELGRPVTISQSAGRSAGGGDPTSSGSSSTLRESSLEQFQQLQREVGFQARPVDRS